MEDERAYPSARNFYDQHQLATALYIVILLCASGSTFLTVLRGTVLAARELWPFLLWIVAADQVIDS